MLSKSKLDVVVLGVLAPYAMLGRAVSRSSGVELATWKLP